MGNIRIATSRDSTVSGDGHAYWAPSSDSGVTYNEITLPTGMVGVSARPSQSVYNRRLYISGLFAPMGVIMEDLGLQILGVPAPSGTPTVTTGTGSGGSSGIAICAVRFGQRIGQSVVVVGEPSGYAPAITLTGQGRHWVDLPTTCTNPRVNVIQGLVGMDGNPPQVAWTRSLGTTTVDENVLTRNLGEFIPVKILPNGEVEVDRGALGVPPYCRFNQVYHDAMWYAGDPNYPNRIYPSQLFNPEGVNTDPDNATYITTKDNLPVTGICTWHDELVVGTPRSLMRIQGYGPDDYSLQVISTYTGVVSGHSMMTFGPQGDLLFASQDGINLYNGGVPRSLMRDTLRNYWRDDFLAHTLNYQNSFISYDRFFDVFLLEIPQDDTTMFRYVGSLGPLLRGEAPDWVFDIRSRGTSALGQFLLPDTDYGYGLYVGSCDGFIRKENQMDDGTDDGDAYNKQFTIQTSALFANDDQCGDDAHGARWTDLNLFIANDYTDVTVECYGGDETSTDAAAPQFSTILAASANDTEVSKTSHDLGPLVDIVGKSITLRLEGSNSVDFSFRGWAVAYTQGRQDRPNR